MRERELHGIFAVVVALTAMAGCMGGVTSSLRPATSNPPPAYARLVRQSDSSFSAEQPPTPAVGPGEPIDSGGRVEQTAVERLADERAARDIDGIYRIGTGDLLETTVLYVPEMSRKVRVGKNGSIQLPLIGTISAAGQSPEELSAEIARRLTRYVKNPQVDVFIQENVSQQVAVTGAVATPGLYPLTRGHLSILDLLSEAGGPSPRAGGLLELVPAPNGSDPAWAGSTEAEARTPRRRSVIRIRLADLMDGTNRAALNLRVVAGDVIHVPEAGSFTIEGWIDKPGTYVLTRETTVLAALAAGGGPLMPAHLGAVEILRSNEDGSAREVHRVDLDAIRSGRAKDVPLRSGDVIRVPASAPLVVPWSLYALMQNLVRIGASVPLL